MSKIFVSLLVCSAVLCMSLSKAQDDNVESETLNDNTVSAVVSVKGADGIEKLKQEVEVDTDNNLEVYTLRDDRNELRVQAILDFTKNMIGFYVPRQKRCFVAGGINALINKPDILKDRLKSDKTLTETFADINYVPVGDTSITDTSIIPERLQSQCEGLPVYWLERNEVPQVTANVRDRRQHSVSGYVNNNGFGGSYNYKNGNFKVAVSAGRSRGGATSIGVSASYSWGRKR